VIEAARQHLTQIGLLGIACRGPVRSILLLSKVPIADIRTLALDSSSQSSAMLARIILDEAYKIQPETHVMPPDLTAMLGKSDAALIIGDPALRIDPDATIWAGFKQEPALADILSSSYEYGKQHLHDIVMEEAAERNIWPGLAYEYLNSIIQYEITDDCKRGMKLYIEHAMKVEEKLAA